VEPSQIEDWRPFFDPFREETLLQGEEGRVYLLLNRTEGEGLLYIP
jgi:hypothetical protein